MSAPVLLSEVMSRVAILRLNRPAALNALTPDLLRALTEAMARAEADPEVGAILLAAEGRAFCAGADLADAEAQPPRDATGLPDLGAALEQGYNPLVLRMQQLRKPIVAAVQGIAAGAGASLALMADLTVAARSASFLQAFVNIGLIPDAGGTWILPRLAGRQRALGMALLGDRLPAETARDWGLIWSVVDDDMLQTEAMALAVRLARGPGVALGHIKAAVTAAADNSLDAQLADEVIRQRACGHTQDFAEGVSAFLQKRPATFRGR